MVFGSNFLDRGSINEYGEPTTYDSLLLLNNSSSNTFEANNSSLDLFNSYLQEPTSDSNVNQNLQKNANQDQIQFTTNLRPERSQVSVENSMFPIDNSMETKIGHKMDQIIGS